MNFIRRYQFVKNELEIKVPPVPGDQRPLNEQLEEFRHSAITKLILDANTWIHVLIPLQDCGRPELVAHVDEIPGVSVVVNIETGIVEISVKPDAPYQVVGCEVAIFAPKAEVA